MQKFYSNGKLLLSGEYLILDGATGLALPTSLGQELFVRTHNSEGVYFGKAWIIMVLAGLKQLLVCQI